MEYSPVSINCTARLTERLTANSCIKTATQMVIQVLILTDGAQKYVEAL